MRKSFVLIVGATCVFTCLVYMLYMSGLWALALQDRDYREKKLDELFDRFSDSVAADCKDDGN